MSGEDKRNALMAALLFVVFAALAYFLPSIMLAAGAVSPAIAIVVAAVFLGLPFVVLWLRGRARR